ncbi:MAG: hypothetical protein D8M59_10600 [Planctomycetes bacterium]|nr:hypothetical protein [Planctomycetota bacterium]
MRLQWLDEGALSALNRIDMAVLPIVNQVQMPGCSPTPSAARDDMIAGRAGSSWAAMPLCMTIPQPPPLFETQELDWIRFDEV